MRNLKKVLALALTVVMLVGMMVVSASAAFEDVAADHDFGTAIEVVSAIEAIEGSNGNFRPDGRLTRADATVIAARVALTRGNANKLSGITAAYTDVPAKAYYAGAVAWATNEGILAGDGAGNFRPNGSLTGYAFAKMMLGVLGYDAEIEGYQNDKDYLVNINYDAARAGLLAGLEDLDLGAKMTRGQAAQMAFNALNANVVTEYEMVILPVNGEWTAVQKAVVSETKTFGEKYSLTYVPAKGEADPTVGGFYTVKDANGKTINASTPAVIEADVVLSGYFYDKDAVKEEFALGNDQYCDPNVTTWNDLYDLTGNGRTVYVWTVNNKICKVDYAYETLTVATWTYDEVTEVYTFSVNGDEITYIKDAKTEAQKLNNAQYENLLALNIDEKGTYIIEGTYVDGTDSWNGYALPEFVTAKAETVGKGGASVKLNGEVIYVAKDAAAAKTALNGVDMAKEYNFYFDSTGSIIHVELADTTPATSDTLYLYVTNVEGVAGKFDPTTGKYATAWSITGVDLTGAEKTINIGATKTVNVGDFITYEIDKDGVFTSEAVALGEKSAEFKGTELQFDGQFVTADTLFVYLRSKLNEKNETVYYITTVVGAHAINAGVDFVNLTKAESKDLTLVVLAGDPKAPEAKTIEDVLYVMYNKDGVDFNYYTLAADGKTKLCNFTVYIDGEKQIVPVDKVDGVASTGNLASGYYAYTVKDGVYTLTDAVAGVEESFNIVANKVVFGNGRYYVTIGGNLVDITDATVYNLTTKSANNVARLYTLSNSESMKSVYTNIKYAQDPVTELYFAEIIYVNSVTTK